MRDEAGQSYVIIAVVIIFVLIFGAVYLISKLKLQENEGIAPTGGVINCEIDQDCDDQSDCTLDSCESEVCSNTDILLCYNGDNCCPKNCNSANDNDCLN